MSEGAVGGENASVETTESATPETTTPETTEAPVSWRDGLGDDLRANPSLTKFDGVPALAQSYVELQKKIGAKGIIVPGEGAGEVEVNEFFNALGRPDSPEGYELGNVEIPEGLPWSQETLDLVIGEGHKLGISKTAMTGLMTKYLEIQGEQYAGQVAELAQAREKAEVELKTSWGSAYDGNVDLANRAFLTGFGDEAESVREIVLADGTKLGDSVAFIKGFAVLGNKFSEHGLVGDKVRRATQTPDEAQREIRKLRGDETFMKAFENADHVEHKDALEKMDAAYQLAYPEESE